MTTVPLPRLSDKQTEILTELPAPDSRNQRQYEKLTELGLVFRVGETYERKLLGDEVVEAIKSGKDSIQAPDLEPDEPDEPSAEEQKQLRETLNKAGLSQESELTDEQRQRALKPGNRTGDKLRAYIMKASGNSSTTSSSGGGRTADPVKKFRVEVTPVIRSMRKELAWSAEQWRDFTVADYVARLERLLEQAKASLAAAKKFQS